LKNFIDWPKILLIMMQTFLIVLGSCLGAIMLLYLFARWYSGTTLFKSKVIAPSDIEADQYYYLPAFSMDIKATAQVEVTKTEDGKIILEASLQQLILDPTVSIVPDTEELVMVTYHGDWFSNDDLTIATSSNGLLDNVAAASEDRIGQIIAQFTSAPKAVLEDMNLIAFQKEVEKPAITNKVTEVQEFNRNFKLSCKDLRAQKISREWKFLVPGLHAGDRKEINASFTITNKGELGKSSKDKNINFDGLITRRLVEQQWEINVEDKLGVTVFSCTVPDLSTVIKIPVKRGYFIKKQQQPKFSNGLLVSNTINKPSEIEAFASIPINIGKAILTIPAQLLQFKINRNKQETEYEKSVLELVKARMATQEVQSGTSIKKVTDQVSDLQSKLKLIETQNKLQPPQVTPEPLPSLGKLPAEPPVKVASLESLSNIRAEISPGSTGKTELDPSFFLNKNFAGNWVDYGKKISGQNNCIPAAAAHTITCWTSNAKPVAASFSQQTIDEVYAREAEKDPNTGLPNGCILSRFLDGWQSKGVGGHVILDYAKLRTQDRDEMKKSLFLYGGAIAGFKMPKTASRQSAKWEVVPGSPELSAEPDSWGGHAVAVVGYDENGLLVVSWGRVIQVTWAFYEKYNDESFTMLSLDWLKDDKISPSKFDLATLQKRLNEFNS